ncbi:MAG: glycosyltransferase [Methanolinea sp.]|jgi:glycosyltransferase involved in cell wall biosynthesis
MIAHHNIKIESPPQSNICEDQPTVSFLILTFNSSQYIQQCLDSVLDQKYGNYEIIIIDGGSKDGTLNILQQYSKESPRFHYFIYPNTTIGKARALGMSHTHGDLIVFLDSDCVLPSSTWLKDMLVGFDSTSVAGVFTFGKYNRKDPSILRYSILSNPYRKAVIDPLIGSQNYIPIGTGHIIIRRELIDKIGGFKDLVAAEDVEVTHSLTNLGYIFKYMPGVEVYHYHVASFSQLIRKNKRNIMGGLNSAAWKTHFLNAKRYSLFSFIDLFLPFIPAISMALKDRDLAWFWHPIVTWFKMLIAFGLIAQRKIRA